jgi:peptidoglycan/xylan/chitin deacetylase (PgdA/CDA1 family)
MRAVLTFHTINDLPGPLSFSPAALESLLAALAEAELPVLALDELHGDRQGDGVASTFDDGISTVFSAAMPILAKRRFRPMCSSSQARWAVTIVGPARQRTPPRSS